MRTSPIRCVRLQEVVVIVVTSRGLENLSGHAGQPVSRREITGLSIEVGVAVRNITGDVMTAGVVTVRSSPLRDQDWSPLRRTVCHLCLRICGRARPPHSAAGHSGLVDGRW